MSKEGLKGGKRWGKKRYKVGGLTTFLHEAGEARR